MSADEVAATAAPGTAGTVATTTDVAVAAARGRNEIIYFALRNPKFVIGLVVVLLFLLAAIIGPRFTDYAPYAYVGPGSVPPSSEFWLGTTMFGQDVYTQMVLGLGSTFAVGLLGGGLATVIGMVIGFTAGYRGGWIDEVLAALTNVVLTIPMLAALMSSPTLARRLANTSRTDSSLMPASSSVLITRRSSRSR